MAGPYARPISHIAASLGIPSSLIALRHRATHEDLPPLSLLHTAIHQSIAYIHHYSFLPMLSSSSSTITTPPSYPSSTYPPTGEINKHHIQSSRCEGLMKGWKKVMKSRLREREVGEENDSGREIRRLKKEIFEEGVEEVIVVLLGEGGLVPIAKKWVRLLLNLSCRTKSVDES